MQNAMSIDAPQIDVFADRVGGFGRKLLIYLNDYFNERLNL
jgi:hypothetical protein